MSKKTQGSKRFQQSVKEIVRMELEDEIEEKYAITEYADKLINRTIPSGVVTNGGGNFFKILPEIGQSAEGNAGRAYNTRIGNKIKLKKISLLGSIGHTAAGTSLVNYANAKLAVRVMILKAKSQNDVEILFQQMPTDELLRFGSQDLDASGVPVAGTGGFGGYTLDPFRAINRDAFSVRYDKLHYVNAPTIVPGDALGGDSEYGLVPSSQKIFSKELTFGKKGLELKFENHEDYNPNNFGYFCVVGYSSMCSPNRPDDDQVRMTMSCVAEYTDA